MTYKLPYNLLYRVVFLTITTSGCDPYDAPKKDFEKTIDFSRVDEIYNARRTRGHGAILVGSTNSIRNNYDLLLTKIDANAEIMWTKTFGGGNVDRGYSVRETSDGGFVVVGFIIVDKRKDMVILRTTSEGKILWSNHFGEYSDEGRAVCELADGSFAVCGTKRYVNGLSDIVVFRITNTGNLLWSKIYFGTNATAENHLCYGYDIEATSDGNLIIAGSVPDSVDLEFGVNYDLYLLKIDPNGQVLWRAQYDTGLQDEFYDVIETPDHDFIAIGRKRLQTFSQVVVARLGPLGQWNRVAFYGTSGNDEAYSILPAYDGGYVMAGRSVSGRGVSGLIMHIDDEEQLLWSRSYGENETKEFRSIVYDGSGHYFLAGYKSARRGSDIYILKIDKNGEAVKH